jgi:small subunit ribosomal protein S20
MPHSNQARKRLRQNEKLRVHNKSIRSEVRTLTKALAAHVEEKEAEAAGKTLRLLMSKLDKATKKNVYHRNTAARRKAKVAALFGTLQA